jgi:hypothetical protein
LFPIIVRVKKRKGAFPLLCAKFKIMSQQINRLITKHRRSVCIPVHVKIRTGTPVFRGADYYIVNKGVHPALLHIGIKTPIIIRIEIR